MRLEIRLEKLIEMHTSLIRKLKKEGDAKKNEAEIEDAMITLEALKLFKKMLGADSLSFEKLCKKRCEICGTAETDCPFRRRDRFCNEADMFQEGYCKALADISC